VRPVRLTSIFAFVLSLSLSGAQWALAQDGAVPDAPATDTASAADDEELEEFTGTGEVEAPPKEPTRRSVEQEQLVRIPGTRGDALKAIEIMPGVARTSGQSDPILRGSAWNESTTYLDGIAVPFLYHFGGLTSFMNSRLVERIDVYPSNYSTRYGRGVGGIVEVRARDPKSDALHGVLDLNLIDSSVLVEAPVGEKTSIAAAARRSNLDFFFENFVPKDAYAVMAAPVYWDYQGFVTHRFSDDHRLRLALYGGRDSVKLLFAEPNDEDPTLNGEVGGTIQFHRAQMALRSRLSPSVTQEITLAAGEVSVEQRIGDLVQEISGPDLRGRAEWNVRISPSLELTAGTDSFAWLAGGRYRGPRPSSPEGDPNSNAPLGSQSPVSLELDTLNVIHAGLYTELGYRPIDTVTITPGVRADYYEDLAAWSFDPRLNARSEISSSTTLKGGVGWYSQPPQYWQALARLGNPALEPYHALHVSAGVEQKLGRSVELDVEGFHKTLENRVVSTPNGAPPAFVNGGSGTIIGAEFSAQIQPSAGSFGYVSYTLSRSMRRDLDAPPRLFDQDQTHILTLALGRELGAGWEVGARFRLVSGNPTTPVTSAVFDARSGTYTPIYGAVNSERNPMFHQLDLRVEKKFQIGRGAIATYLDLQNAYNAQNQEGVRYSYDYRQREGVSGLPIFPNLGLRGEL
jgi:hypothetical protein